MQNITSPELRWIDGSCYRVNDSHQLPEHKDEYCDDNAGDERLASDEESIPDVQITVGAGGRVQATIHVPQPFIGNIIGVKGSTRKRVESDTKTEIRVPGRGQTYPVSISGANQRDVLRACRRIRMIIEAARKRQGPTHFISIPLNSEPIISQFNVFMNGILEGVPPRGVEPSVFVSAQKLHATLLTLHLADNHERETAKALMEESKTKIIRDILGSESSFQVSLLGTAYMNDDPANVDVLYAQVTEVDAHMQGSMVKLSQAYRELFENTGYLVGNRANIKMHVTLMNSRKRETAETSTFVKRIPFDASDILKTYDKFEFGQHSVTCVHLSQIETKAPDGYYQATSVITF